MNEANGTAATTTATRLGEVIEGSTTEFRTHCYDLYAAPPRMRAMASRIPDCRFALMPEAGHAAFWEQPEQWNELVLDFIQEH